MTEPHMQPDTSTGASEGVFYLSIWLKLTQTNTKYISSVIELQHNNDLI